MEPQTRESPKARLRRIFYNWMNRLANRLADGQTAITQRMAQAVRIPPAQLWGCWPSGVTLKPFAAAAIHRHWPQDDAPVQLIYIGSLHHERNLLQLCQAVHQANQDGCSFCLTLVGSGTAYATLESFAAQSNGCVLVQPPVPHAQVPALLAMAHVGTLPFPDEEKFRVSSPIKLFEYLAAGLPILATHIACHTDVIRDGHYAIWAEDASEPGLTAALHELWQRRHDLPEMGYAALSAALAWTWMNAAQQLKKALVNGLQQKALVMAGNHTDNHAGNGIERLRG
jgi:glycosyltransferase involved in cell wall biosynthesis